MDTSIIYNLVMDIPHQIPRKFILVSQWITYVALLSVVVYILIQCMMRDTSFVSIWIYKKQIKYAQNNANLYLERYRYIQEQINCGIVSSHNQVFEIADLKSRMYTYALKNLHYEVKCGLLHIRKPHRKPNATIANAFFYEVVDESLDAIEIIINYENSSTEDIFESRFYDFFKEALQVIKEDLRKSQSRLNLEKIERIAHTAYERRFEKVHRELIELTIALKS